MTHYCHREREQSDLCWIEWCCTAAAAATTTSVKRIVTLQDVNDSLATLRALLPQHRQTLTELLGLHAPLEAFWSDCLEVRQSAVHGRGVFATRRLPAGVLLTGYPCHLLVAGREILQCAASANLAGLGQPELAQICDKYGFALSDELRLVGLPTECDDRRLLGHMLNDGCLADVFGGTPVERLRDKRVLLPLLMRFYGNTLAHVNCIFRCDRSRVVCCVVSRREIQADEELLVSYGMPYWHEKNYGAGFEQRYPFVLQNMLALRGENRAFRKLLDRSIAELDRPALATF